MLGDVAAPPFLMIRALLGSLVPCAACGRRAAGPHGACGPCRTRFADPATGGAETSSGPCAVAVAWCGPYDGPYRRAVRALKYGGRRDVARPLGHAVAERVRAERWPVARVAHVPLHPARRLRRGFDQAEVLGRRVATELGVPFRPSLRRLRPTRRQARLEGRARQANVDGAFRSAPVPPVPVLLIDDVLTTGATTAACAAALRGAGARSVRIAVACRARPAADVRFVVPSWADAAHETAAEPGARQGVRTVQNANAVAVATPSSAPASTCG